MGSKKQKNTGGRKLVDSIGITACGVEFARFPGPAGGRLALPTLSISDRPW